jgi:hypothetical protein
MPTYAVKLSIAGQDPPMQTDTTFMSGDTTHDENVVFRRGETILSCVKKYVMLLKSSSEQILIKRSP